MIKVGFVFAFQNKGWLGGINYYKNLFRAIHSLPDRQIEPVIFTGHKIPKDLLEGFPPFQIIQTGLLDRLHPHWFIRKLWHRATGYDRFLEKLLLKNKIQVLSHHMPIGPDSIVPTIGWIPDFQHKHLPEFFSAKEIEQRNRAHEDICKNCRQIIVSSHDAKSDILVFNPESANKVSVLQFTPHFDHNPDLPSLSDLEEKYNFKAPYFHLPNQFWIHKNHAVAIKALKILKDQGKEVTILATGNTSDFRQPMHFQNLLNLIAANDVAENFKILGLVPHQDLVALMTHSTAIINPSLFEGWSTTVEEAKSLGKDIILSDIAVHKEQAPEGGVYFNHDDPKALADAVLLLNKKNHEPTSMRDIIKNESLLLEKIKNFGETYKNIIFICFK